MSNIGQIYITVDQIYCQLELDSFGYFFLKAKTSCKSQNETAWDEDFEMELEGCQTMRILCYKKVDGQSDQIIGKSALEVGSKIIYFWRKKKFDHSFIQSLYKNMLDQMLNV